MRVLRDPLGLGVLVGASAVVVAAAILWLAYLRAAEPTTSSEVASTQVLRGERIYNANCASCHGGPTGGAMMDYPPRHNANGHTWHHPDCELTEVIRTGGGPMVEMMRRMMAPPGAPTMPAFRPRLSEDEIDAVLAYIKTMWTPEQRALQERATRQSC